MNAGIPPEQQKFATDLLFALQHHQHLTTKQIYFIITLLFPGPFSWKFAVFNFFTTHSINISIILTFAIAIVTAIIFICLLIYFLPKILRILYYKNQKYILLAVKPQHNAIQST